MDRQARTLHFTEWQKRAFFCLSYFFNKIYEHKYFRNKCSVCGTYCTLSRSLCFFTSSLVLQLAQSVQGQWTHNVLKREQYIASSPAATCQYKLMHSAAASRPRFKTIFCSRISGCYLSWCIYHPVSRFRLQHIGPKNADSWWEFRAQWKKSQDAHTMKCRFWCDAYEFGLVHYDKANAGSRYHPAKCSYEFLGGEC